MTTAIVVYLMVAGCMATTAVVCMALDVAVRWLWRRWHPVPPQRDYALAILVETLETLKAAAASHREATEWMEAGLEAAAALAADGTNA